MAPPTNSIWQLYKAVKKDDNSGACVFVFDPRKCTQPGADVLAANALRRSKVLRHPGVLTSVCTEENTGVVYLATEQVVTLESALPSIIKNPGALAWGLYQLASVLSFLNNDCHLIHGNVCFDTVYVTRCGDWKLGGLEFVSEIDNLHSSPLKAHCGLLNVRAPEVEKGMWDDIKQGSPWAVDSWLLGSLITRLFSSTRIPQTLVNAHLQLSAQMAGRRMNPADFMTKSYFDNPYVETFQFLESITLKDSSEREQFFKKLVKLLDELPENVCMYKILPHFITALDLQLYGANNSQLIRPLLKIAKNLSHQEYQLKIVPNVVKWFASPDKALRTNLLENIESIMEHLTPSLINDQVFPEVSNWFLDPNPALREATVRAMLFIVPKLAERTVNTHVLRFFAKLQLDPEPCIRTNTTICLGKITPFLSEATRKRVLIPAFCRPLQDPFPPSRIAGVTAFAVTKEYYTAQEVAAQVIPCVAPLLVDPEKKVRDEAFRCVNILLAYVEKAMSRQPETSPDSAGAVTSAASVPPGSGVFNWAMSSLSQKLATGPVPQLGGSAEPVQQPTAEKAPSRTVETAQAQAAKPAAATAEAAENAAGGDGWDDDGGWGDDVEVAPKPASRTAFSPAPAVQPQPPKRQSPHPGALTLSQPKSQPSASASHVVPHLPAATEDGGWGDGWGDDGGLGGGGGSGGGSGGGGDGWEDDWGNDDAATVKPAMSRLEAKRLAASKKAVNVNKKPT
eukprot:TRINITY_DN8420_c0_g2_i1.p1 TRINITY_DN8420_c0_g2~~TRINITY_DN8420_c0_g2_i1.p1  ORF type:complete len:761 (-),score=188.75 TRINITY_DN8420_c0_g2_i1:12-2219(-)